MRYLTNIVYAIALSLIFTSCNEKENIVVQEDIPTGLLEMKENGLSFDDMGKLHNDGLDAFMKNKPSYKYENFNSLVNDIDIEFSKTGSNVFKKRSNYDNFNSFDLKSKGNSNLTYNNLITNVYKDRTTKKVENLFKIVIGNNLSYEENEVIIESYIKGHNLTEIEVETIKLFTSISKYSNDFWLEHNKYESKNLAEKGCDAKSQLYFADAVGFLLGGGLGGIGMSWAIYEIQKQGGGGCII
jgi:hypothetical protein